MNSNYSGFIFVIISSISFGLMPIFATLAYKSSLSIEVILLFRFLIAAVLMNIYVLLKKYSYPYGKTLVLLIAMGSIGYAIQSFSYFTALSLIGSSLTSILLYLYPGIVLLLSIFLLKLQIIKSEFFALLLASFGAILVIGFDIKNINFVGIMFGITAAIVYAIYILVGSKATKGINSFVASTVIISASALVYLVNGIANKVEIPSSLEQWQWIVAIAIISTIIAIVTFFAGMKIIGPVKVSMISTFEPVVTLVFSFWVLNESMDIYQIFGAVLIIMAALLLAK